MTRPARVLLFALTILASAPLATAAEVSFRVTLPADANGPASGRLVVYLTRDGSPAAEQPPAAGPFWHDPQPLFGADVTDLKPGGTVIIGPDTAFPDAFPAPPGDLPSGDYKAQAVLDRGRRDSDWKREPGNLYSDPIAFTVPADGEKNVEIDLTKTTREPTFPDHPALTEVVVESKLLGDFAGEPVPLRAGVLEPLGFDPAKRYGTIYVVPGFGGTHAGVRQYLLRNTGDWAKLRKAAYIVVLDPESPNGHTLFCDSRVNGPRGEALVKELIPAIEAKFPAMRPDAASRIVTGHSSGGWSSLWLGLTYPETFGGVWSSGPDPVDFRRFELIDIYADANAFVDAEGQERPSCRYDLDDDGEYEVTLTVRGEDGGEGVMGPNNASGQQWDSWQACWGTPDLDNPRVARPLYDARTGRIDRDEAASYEAYDIRLLLSRDPARYVPLFRERVHLIAGDNDNYYLDEAVMLLQAELESHAHDGGGTGYVKVLADADHEGSLFAKPEMRAWPGEMVRFLGESPR